MALTMMKIQKAALKAKAASESAKMHRAAFGVPQKGAFGTPGPDGNPGYADGGGFTLEPVDVPKTPVAPAAVAAPMPATNSVASSPIQFGSTAGLIAQHQGPVRSGPTVGGNATVDLTDKQWNNFVDTVKMGPGGYPMADGTPDALQAGAKALVNPGQSAMQQADKMSAPVAPVARPVVAPPPAEAQQPIIDPLTRQLNEAAAARAKAAAAAAAAKPKGVFGLGILGLSDGGTGTVNMPYMTGFHFADGGSVDGPVRKVQRLAKVEGEKPGMLSDFERRLGIKAGSPDTGALGVSTPTNTKGAKAPLFGAMLADGGVVPIAKMNKAPRKIALVAGWKPGEGSVADPSFKGAVHVMPGFTADLKDGGIMPHTSNQRTVIAALGDPIPVKGNGTVGGKKASFGKPTPDGGPVVGPGTGVSDSIPARYSHGEYVLPADTVQAIGKDKLDQIKDATHTPAIVAQQNGMAGGGTLPTYDVEEIPDIEAAPAPNRFGTANGNANMRYGPSAEATNYNATRGGFVGGEPVPAAPVGAMGAETGAPAEAAAPAAEAATGAEGVADAAKGFRATAAGVYNTVRNGVGSVVRGAGQVAKFGARAMPALAAADLATRSEEAGAGSDVIRKPDGTVQNTMQGFAQSPEFSALSSADKYKLIQERNDPSTTPGRQAQIDQLIKGMNPVAQTADPSAKYAAGTPGATNAAPSTTPPPAPVTKTSQFGSSTIQETGRGNFTGVGTPGEGTGTGSAQDRWAQGQLADDRAELAKGPTNQWVRGLDGQMRYEPINNQPGQGAGFGGLQMPGFQESPQAAALRSKINDLATDIGSMRPGEMGLQRKTRQLVALQSAHSALTGQDDRVNAFNQASFGRGLEWQMHKNQLANQALGYDVQRQGNAYQYSAKMAELQNQKEVHGDALAQEKYTNAQKGLESLAAAHGDKDLADTYKMIANEGNFPTQDGRSVKYHMLDGQDKENADGRIQAIARAYDALIHNGGAPAVNGKYPGKPAGFTDEVWSALSHMNPHMAVQFMLHGGTNFGPMGSSIPNVNETAAAAKYRADQEKQ